jgi:hypothetical protein
MVKMRRFKGRLICTIIPSGFGFLTTLLVLQTLAFAAELQQAPINPEFLKFIQQHRRADRG